MKYIIAGFTLYTPWFEMTYRVSEYYIATCSLDYSVMEKFVFKGLLTFIGNAV